MKLEDNLKKIYELVDEVEPVTQYNFEDNVICGVRGG